MAISDHLWCSHDRGVHTDRLFFDLDLPVLHRLLTEERLDHLLNSVNFLLGINSGLGKSVSHAAAFSNLIGHSIKLAELWRQVEITLAHLDLEQGLIDVSDFLIIALEEVVSN